jgi:uncharacterized protein YjlB
LVEDHPFPNNSRLPLLVYRGVFARAEDDLAGAFERAFTQHGWGNGWRDGIHDFDHFHSTAHEVLGCYRGDAEVRFGGPRGVVVRFATGDAVVVPAGVAHRSIRASSEFAVVGAYAQDRDWDMNCGHAGERPGVDANIAALPLPDTDPVRGMSGPLVRAWRR